MAEARASKGAGVHSRLCLRVNVAKQMLQTCVALASGLRRLKATLRMRGVPTSSRSRRCSFAARDVAEPYAEPEILATGSSSAP
jgi:hypothetical protein